MPTRPNAATSSAIAERTVDYWHLDFVFFAFANFVQGAFSSNFFGLDIEHPRLGIRRGDQTPFIPVCISAQHARYASGIVGAQHAPCVLRATVAPPPLRLAASLGGRRGFFLALRILFEASRLSAGQFLGALLRKLDHVVALLAASVLANFRPSPRAAVERQQPSAFRLSLTTSTPSCRGDRRSSARGTSAPESTPDAIPGLPRCP